MSNFINDTLENQIQRGELFYAGIYTLALEPGGSYSWGIETNTYPCKAGLEIVFPQTCTFWVYSGVTTAFSAGTTRNINQDSATTLDADWDENMSTTAVGGSTIFEIVAPHGIIPMNTPMHRETGLILDEGTRYQFRLRNDGGSPADLTVYALLRDLV